MVFGRSRPLRCGRPCNLRAGRDRRRLFCVLFPPPSVVNAEVMYNSDRRNRALWLGITPYDSPPLSSDIQYPFFVCSSTPPNSTLRNLVVGFVYYAYYTMIHSNTAVRLLLYFFKSLSLFFKSRTLSLSFFPFPSIHLSLSIHFIHFSTSTPCCTA